MNKLPFKIWIEKLKKGKALPVIGIVGIILIGLSSFSFSESKPQKENTFSINEYKAELEKQAAVLVQGISGDNTAKVFITLEGGVKYSYADEITQNTADKTDGTSSDTKNETSKSYITVRNSDGSEQALLVCEYLPEVRGVAVVCKAKDNTTAEKIKEALAALLGVTTRRVYIG